MNNEHAAPSEVQAFFKSFDELVERASAKMRRLRTDAKKNGPSLEEQAFAPTGGAATPSK